MTSPAAGLPDAVPDAVRGALWMLVSALCYVASATLMRAIGDSYSAFELTFIRAVVAVIILGPIFLKGLRGNLMPERPFAHLMVGVFSYVGILAWVYAAARMPVADFFALQFVTPLCTISMAILFLRERTDRTSWICALISSAGYASVNTIVRSLSNRVSATAIVFYANFLLVPISLPLAIYDWTTPISADWPEILGVCVLSTIGYVTVTRAITLAPARVVQPVNFMRMPIAAGFGFAFFGELPDLWTWIGAVVIFLATSFAVQHGTRR